MTALTTRHEKAFSLLFAELEATAMEQRAAFLGTPGNLTERTNDGMRGWWTRDTTLNPTVGGKAELGFAKRATVFRMIVETLDGNRRVRMSYSGDPVEWAGTYLEWRVEAVEGGTLLSLRHGDWKAQTDYCASCNTMWGNLMFRLKAYVESGIPQPQWTE